MVCGVKCGLSGECGICFYWYASCKWPVRLATCRWNFDNHCPHSLHVLMRLIQRVTFNWQASQRKSIKYAEFAQTYLFYPLAFETMDPLNVVRLEFISDLGHRSSRVTDDPRETSLLFTRRA